MAGKGKGKGKGKAKKRRRDLGTAADHILNIAERGRQESNKRINRLGL